MDRQKKKIYVTFIDLTSVFDSFDRSQLCGKLSRTDIDMCLLKLRIKLPTDITARVRMYSQGSLSDPISLETGVRLGCLLVPFFYLTFIIMILQCHEVTKLLFSLIQYI